MINFLNKLLQSKLFPISFKYLSLIAFIILIISGLSAFSNNPDFIKHLRNTNLGNLIVWSYWWPAIVFMAIFFGRFWCMICPVEIITSFFSKIGFRKKRPDWLLSGWAITIFYILILFIGIQGYAIHRNPYYMSIYLLVIVGVSILVGTIYEKNTFCRYVCPVGYLLGLYARLSFLGWRVKEKSMCETCTDKSCIHKKFLYQSNFKSCGVDLYPAKISTNGDCILCGGCLKTCSEYKSTENQARPNPQISYLGFAHDLYKLNPLKVAEMVFVVVVSGFVISEIWSEWSLTNNYLAYLPDLLIDIFKISNKILAGLIKGAILFLFVPLFIWIIPFLLSKVLGNKLTLIDYLLHFGIVFIPIIAAAHLSKAILKSTSRLPYFEHLASDFSGMQTAKMIIEGKITLLKNPFWLDILVSGFITLIIAFGIYLSIRLTSMINKKLRSGFTGKINYLIPILYGSIFLVMIVIWRWF